MKKGLSITIVLILFYFGTLVLFGRTRLSTQLRNKSNSTYATYQWTSNVNVIGNLNLEKIAESFDQKDIRVELITAEKDDRLKNVWFRENNYNYALIADPFYYPYIEVRESENFEEYSAYWDREYLWCFFFWIETRDEMVAIS